MNIRQQIAYAHPCRVAEATTHPRFRWTKPLGGAAMSLILTANVGLE